MKPLDRTGSQLACTRAQTIPDIIRESADFVSRLQSDSIWTVVLEKVRHGVGCVTLPLLW